METVEHKVAKIKVAKATDGSTVLSIDGEKWGPVVSGRDLGEAKEKFLRAFKVSLLLKTFCSINHSMQNDTFGIKKLKENILNSEKEIIKVKEELQAV
jgi:hypothetical protein